MDLSPLLPLVLKASIVVMVVAIGLNARWRDAAYLLRNPGLLFRSALSMNVLMPVVAAGFVVAFHLPIAVDVALVALAVSPVPPILPRKELKAGGHVPYAIGLLVAIAVLAVVTVPITVSWFTRAFDRSGGITPLEVAKIVSTSVLAPLAVGMALRRWMPALAEKLAWPLAMLGTTLLVASVLPLAYASWPEVHALLGDGTVLVFAAMCVTGLAIGHLLGGPASDDRAVLALSTASRHPAVALAIAVAGGVDSRSALAAILLYLIVATIVCLPYVAWRRRQSGAAGRSLASSGGD